MSRHNKRLILLCKKQGWLCHLCGTRMRHRGSRAWSGAHKYRWPHDLWPTFDHDTPRSLGGKRGENLRAAHWACNQVKNNQQIQGLPLECYG